MSNWIKKAGKILNSKNGFFTFVRAQFSSQISSQVDFLVSILCVNVFGLFFGLATLLGNIIGGLVNCFINYKWTFKAKGLYVPHVLIKFILVWIGSVFLNTQGTILFTKFVMKSIPLNNMPHIVVENVFLIPKIVVSITVGLVWNYNMQRIFVYKDRDFGKYFSKIGINWFKTNSEIDSSGQNKN